MAIWDFFKKHDSDSKEVTDNDLFRAIKEKNVEKIHKIFQEHPDSLKKASPSGEYPIHAAITVDHPEIVTILLKAGTEVDRKLPRTGETPLHLPIKFKLKEMIRLLLEKGADFSISDPKGNISIVKVYEMKELAFFKEVVHANPKNVEQHLGTFFIAACFDGSMRFPMSN